jgi:hypothetical protein
MIARQLESELILLKDEFPIIAILGPRQSGKTTIARKLFSTFEYVSFEDYDIREFAENDPRGFLNRFSQEVIFDEIQRVPRLISYLQTHVDRSGKNGKVVITGSHNFLLMEQITQSLAGRVGITKLLPFSMQELNGIITPSKDEIMFNGLYPRIYDQNIRPESFYRNYISTYIEKDIRQIKKVTDLDKFTRFIRLLAARTGQELVYSAISEECGVANNTVIEWVSVLEASFLIYLLRPYHKNYNKRLVKRPKIYFLDTGLVCNLLGIKSKDELALHYLRGNIFETYVISEILKSSFNTGERFDMYFWRDNHRKEIDLIIDSGLEQRGVEIKSSETFNEKFLSGLKYWQQLSGVDSKSLFLLYGGDQEMMRNGISVVSWKNVYEGLKLAP